ncbi:MAG: acetyl-CoA carboxylase biotin carboxylase subunit [Myxococcales bacterium]|nr:acetyl-CoA carboxylase biotin carboxylase subunit [Myxococcales bacterium]
MGHTRADGVKHKVLIANRGEIACRVIRACRELGLPTVAVYSEADSDAVHTWMADERVLLGGAESVDSYLRADRVLAACLELGVTLVHPGYGFLSENADFREACDAAGVGFVGPSAFAMRQMGVKTLARETMTAAGVPVVPGTDQGLPDGAAAQKLADEIGYPVMLKAAAGGGGKGMRLVFKREDIVSAFDGARREALAYFSDDTVYIEKAIVQPRHVEVQILADTHGNTVHVLDRECSVQRRNQKVIEESPAPFLSDATRHAMGQVAVQAAEAVDYVGAGTIEFLVDQDENFYFLEMNTRLQVEHPVTELVTGIDLVVEMLRVAMGEPLSFRQDDVSQRGHAVECRIYAEDPAQNFLPSPGRLHVYRPPHGPGIRVDDGCVEGGEIPRFYDPMIAKVSAHGSTREQAIARMDAALERFQIAGIAHNVPYLRWLLASDLFQGGRYDTGIIGHLGDYTVPEPPEGAEGHAAIALAAILGHRAASRPAVAQSASKTSNWTTAARTAHLRGR